MLYLATFFWGWLLASLLLGLAMGWIAVVHRGPAVSKTMARWLAASGGGAGRSKPDAGFVNSLFGYWLDLFLIMFALYLFGCAVGSWLRDRVVSRTTPAT